jgi:hypothetical protein
MFLALTHCCWYSLLLYSRHIDKSVRVVHFGGPTPTSFLHPDRHFIICGAEMLKMLGIRSSTWDICSILPKKNYSTWKIKVSVVSILQTTFHTTYSGQALFRDGHRCVLTRKFNSSDRKSNHHFGPASCSRGLSYYARVRHVNGSPETE